MNNPQEKKMKKSVLVTIILTILAVAFVLGITGSINLSNKKSDENEPAPEGRLVGEKNGAIEPTARSFRATSTEERATP